MDRLAARMMLRGVRHNAVTKGPSLRRGQLPLHDSFRRPMSTNNSRGSGGSTSSDKPAVTNRPSGGSQVAAPVPSVSSLLRASPLWQRSPFARFFDEFEREFANDPFFAPMTAARPAFVAAPEITMNIDISETDKQYVVKADLPGVKKDNVKVSFKDHVLSIVAERKEEKTEDDDTKHYSDFSYGKIVRHLRMPDTADKDSVEATMEDGVLTIRLNKNEQAEQQTTIPIK